MCKIQIAGDNGRLALPAVVRNNQRSDRDHNILRSLIIGLFYRHACTCKVELKARDTACIVIAKLTGVFRREIQVEMIRQMSTYVIGLISPKKYNR